MEPTSYREFIERFQANQRIEGEDYGRALVSSPCPFCAAPNFMKYTPLTAEYVMQLDHRCIECGRSAKCIITYHFQGKNIEVVQTGGPDQPVWLVPTIRRVDPDPVQQRVQETFDQTVERAKKTLNEPAGRWPKDRDANEP